MPRTPRAGAADYDCSKGALRNLTRTLVLEVSELGITVNNIAPGKVLTPFNQKAVDDPDFLEEQVPSMPLKRAAKPEEIAGLARFLASSEADYVTEATYVMGGGLMQMGAKAQSEDELQRTKSEVETHGQRVRERFTKRASRSTAPFRSAAVAVGAAACWSVAHRRAMNRSDWAASDIEPRSFGQLWARSAGRDGDAVVLLHGLISTGDVFGATYDRLVATHRLVRPDLLGFGRSMDEKRTSFTRDDHLDALDELAVATGLFESSRWTLGAHSMGVSLALSWAARHPDRVVRVVGWGAPTYPSPEEARARVAGSLMARLFALDTDLAARACALSCRHRIAASWISVAAEPGLPVPIARAAPLHTWPAYRDAIQRLVLDADWEELVTSCDRQSIDVRLVWGANDRTGDVSYAKRLVEGTRHASVQVLDHGDHRLPLTHPATCAPQLTAP